MSGFEVAHQPEQARAVAHVRDAAGDRRLRPLGGEHLQDGIYEGRLGIFDDQQPLGAEGDDAVGISAPMSRHRPVTTMSSL